MTQKDLHIHIDLGDDGRYNTTGIGTITFKRESGSHLCLKNVMFILVLKKNLIFVVILEDHGYDVIFSKGKPFIRHIDIVHVKKIGVCVKNLYKLDVEDCVALSSKVDKVQGHYVGELWHKILGHLHHVFLKIMQQITTSLSKGALEKHMPTRVVPWGSI